MNEVFLDESVFESEVPVIGWTCTYAPEELIFAAGFQPVRIAEPASPAKLADAYFHRNLCPYVKTCLDSGLRNKNPQMKGLVVANSCNAMRIFYHYWSRYVSRGSFVHFMNVPKKTDAHAVRFFSQEIEGLKSALENFFEVAVSDEALWEAISVYNETRALMDEINAMRKKDTFPFQSARLFSVVRAAQSAPRREFNRELQKLINLLKIQEESISPSTSPRIMILGSLLPGPKLLEIVEEAGARVVYDDLCSGSRYFECGVEMKGDPVQALSRRYLLKPPCARMKDTDLRLDNARKKIDEFRVNGVIYVTIKFCDNHLYDFPVFKEELEKAGIPVLQIEEDYMGGNIGQIRTRVEAFVEML